MKKKLYSGEVSKRENASARGREGATRLRAVGFRLSMKQGHDGNKVVLKSVCECLAAGLA